MNRQSLEEMKGFFTRVEVVYEHMAVLNYSAVVR